MTAALTPMDVAGRLDRLRSHLGPAGCDALLVTNRSNIRYLTGFTGSAGMLLVGPELALLVTDGRYRTQSEEQIAAAGVSAEVSIGGPADQRQALAAAGSGFGRVGLEAASVSWQLQRSLATDVLGRAELVATEDVVEELRRAKDAGEVARIRAAAAVADRALAAVLPLFGEGRSEAEVALALDSEMRRLGAEAPAFETIVASGPNGAKPHARPGPRPIVRGDTVVVDFGATVDGYRSDMTRTFWVGERPEAELVRIFEVVEASQAAGVAAVAAGVSAAEVDATCRRVIAEAGWADQFVHGTGHGVGIDIHEAPAVSATSTDTLGVDEVVTVEPGIYLPGRGGVRIEDTVVITGDGVEPLTGFTKDPTLAVG
ncbi:MAG TPA: aminopeptidase P family protein [Acidimicrobiales bacterium]|nr:aminopeptidase P family protein [Acidimicrobiales bacterium]